MPRPKGSKNKSSGPKNGVLEAADKAIPECGFTDEEVAKFYGVDVRTISRWKKEYPTWFDSFKRIKNIKDAKVEKSLFERATGYSHPDVHISNYKGRISVTNVIKHYPPDPTSMIFWLKNRQKDKWRDKQEHDHSGTIQLKQSEASDKAYIDRQKKFKNDRSK